MSNRLKSLLAVLVVGIVTAATVASRPARSGLTVHEWGTFTTVAGEDGNAIDWYPLGGPADLPCFVEHYVNKLDQFPGFSNPSGLPGLTPLPVPAAGITDAFQGKISGVVVARAGEFDYQRTRGNVQARVRMETPVLYFYSPSAVTANVRVDFPRGLMTEWYPHATVTQPSVGTAALNSPSMVGTIEWKDVAVSPTASGVFPGREGSSHYYAARETDATPLTTSGQPEKFLFYRGVANFDVPLSATLAEEGAIRVNNLGSEPLPGVILFENRRGKIGFRANGALRGSVTLASPTLDANFAALRTELETMLVGAGLFPKEAAAMVATWKDSWFEEGTRVFYVFPQRAIDVILPLKITPAPVSVARVFVGRMEVITPEIRGAVDFAMATNDTAALSRYGRFFGPIADRIMANRPISARAPFQLRANQLLANYVKRVTACE